MITGNSGLPGTNMDSANVSKQDWFGKKEEKKMFWLIHILVFCCSHTDFSFSGRERQLSV